MICPSCKAELRRNVWSCPECGKPLPGGVVFVTGISGSSVGATLGSVMKGAEAHGHRVRSHDVGSLMESHARENEPELSWDRILDASPRVLRYLRALALQDIIHAVSSDGESLHLVDLHLSFRWKAFLTRGFEPYLLRAFIPSTRCFINVVEDLPKIQDRLQKTSWGKREILELLIWRDEELLLADLFADVCGRVPSYAVASGEPPEVLEGLIWHPERKRVYLSFPITAILNDQGALTEIESFRDEIRSFLMVFDPYACRDYDETYRREEMKALRPQVGETTMERDFRFIDQAEAVVVYYPKKVASKGVDSEMRHAVETGKPVFLYCPEDLGGGPFQPPADHVSADRGEFLRLLREKLATV